MDELTTWLRGVLDTEQRKVLDAVAGRHPGPWGWMLADIEAKRAILDQYTEVHGQVLDALAVGDVDAAPTATEHSYATVVRLLASAYRDRPGYREEWRP